MEKIELLVRKNALKDVEIWLHQQYEEIDARLQALEENDEN